MIRQMKNDGGLGRRAHRVTTFWAASILAVAGMTAVVSSTPAHADQQRQVIGTGLTKSAGSVLDPLGHVWVSDSVAGFCRMSEPSNGQPGTIDKSTCLGGSSQGGSKGPVLPGVAVVLDPTPSSVGSGDETAFIPDAAAGSSRLVRAVWDPPSDLFEYSSTLSILDGDVRPNAVSDGPDGNIYLSFANARSIIKIVDPTIMHPSIETIASVTTKSLGLVAAGRDSNGHVSVYVLETTGMKAFSAPDDGDMTNYVPAASYNVGIASSIHYDYDANVIYAGTGTAATAADAGKDKVSKLDLTTGVVDNSWALGFSKIGGLGMRGGQLLVMDDPGQLNAAPATGQGRVSILGGVTAKITSGPTQANGTQAPNPDFTNDTTPTFGVSSDPAGSALECSMGGAWTDCTSGTYTAATLTNGSQTFSVRPAPGGVPVSRTFKVDTVAPAPPVFTAPNSGQVVNGKPVLGATFETGTTLACSVDSTADSAFKTCVPGDTFSLTTEGAHTLRIRSTDPAGNVSPATSINVTADLTAPQVAITAPASGATVGAGYQFMFSSNSTDVAGFRCRLGTNAFTECTSPKVYADIANGANRFEVEARDAAGNTTVAGVNFTVFIADTTPPTVSADPAAGTYGPGTKITLTANEAGAKIYYTENGTTPTTASTLYAGPIAMGTKTVSFIAVDASNNASAPQSRAYVLDSTAPVVTPSPLGGNISLGQKITLTTETGAKIYYSTDNSTPTLTSPSGITTVTLTPTATTTVKYFAVDAAGNQSAVASQTYTVPAAPANTWKDFNADSKNDVLARDSAGTLWLYPGNGTGGWLTRVNTGTGWNNYNLLVPTRDFSGDGRSDVLARDSAGQLWLFKGNGLGGWQPAVAVGSGWTGMTSIVAPGDFSGDGKADVLARDASGILWLYKGDGLGQFSSGRTQVGSGWNTMNAIFSTGDFNGDGKTDILARDTGGALWLYPGNGSAGWGTRSQIGSGWGGMTALLGPGDFNGNGKADVMARDASGNLWLYPGNGSGGWLAWSQIGTGWQGFTSLP
ncbi:MULTISPECIES: chitobiase/beta-hexosaminidase C-terminal domain-containing protein [Micrococcaceae]|uniref:chitobiase/beta-hexosaminidase C-terminal domain-containing protein n=1 Tax=Micrococcaceae TaxID=1268 RepID=UPI002148DE2D|nr:chitobiase/beta-hexosaminidase C-terminal domain-containing protein [Paenarthrobacter sp. UW852]MCR1161297.1 chitobiase/beta-hexosaminidase C-terminal domain-containing protein [Paenarthrobacter sp. UW852]